jgi:hypothetical protein
MTARLLDAAKQARSKGLITADDYDRLERDLAWRR